MKRKILLLFAAFLLGMALSACESNTKEKLENQNTGGTAQENENIEETTLDDLESYLLEQGVLSGKRTEVDAEKIMAEAGFAYKDSNVDTLFKQQAKQAVDKAYPEIYAKYLQRQESESDTSRG